ncbi:DUF3017 domain-containing protein [Corynebacterium sp. HMSC04H06]|uniref:DUF3017 domain-containing protein n=1 Tax=Corynebacterium sp. HMSC04H06 TaxID=1581050 RepID=UPI0009F38B9D|nr:DUF3017 domain-containing protein [Corynebacterium sp. HMSC04H06]
MASPINKAQAAPARQGAGLDKTSLDNPHDRHVAPSKLPAKVQWAMIGAFVAVVVLSGVFALLEHWRRAAFALGAAMLWLVVVRATCDSRRVGVFSVRSRRFDCIFSAVVGAALVFLAVSVDALGS